jgi:hypothetical protein
MAECCSRRAFEYRAKDQRARRERGVLRLSGTALVRVACANAQIYCRFDEAALKSNGGKQHE